MVLKGLWVMQNPFVQSPSLTVNNSWSKKDSLTIEAECVLHAGLTLPILEGNCACSHQKDWWHEYGNKRVETVRTELQQTGSWTKKTILFILDWQLLWYFIMVNKKKERKKRKLMHHQTIHPPTWCVEVNWKPIINMHQSLKWILYVYKILVAHACLTVSCIYM